VRLLKALQKFLTKFHKLTIHKQTDLCITRNSEQIKHTQTRGLVPRNTATDQAAEMTLWSDSLECYVSQSRNAAALLATAVSRSCSLALSVCRSTMCCSSPTRMSISIVSWRVRVIACLIFTSGATNTRDIINET